MILKKRFFETDIEKKNWCEVYNIRIFSGRTGGDNFDFFLAKGAGISKCQSRIKKLGIRWTTGTFEILSWTGITDRLVA